MKTNAELIKIAKKLTNEEKDPLAVRETNDGGIVVVTAIGQKFIFTSDQVKSGEPIPIAKVTNPPAKKK
jgi:hypothetical protein